MSRCPFHQPPPPTPNKDKGSSPLPPHHNQNTNTIPSQQSSPNQPGPTEDDLECPICLRLLYLPTSLPCGHTFCRPCLTQACQNNTQPPPNNNTAQQCCNAPNNLHTRCPVCRASSCLPSLPNTNALLSALIEKYLPQASSHRTMEAVRDAAEEKARFATKRRIRLQVNADPNAAGGGALVVTVSMDGISRCPMSQGTLIPITFYAARVEIRAPPPFHPNLVTMSDTSFPSWTMQFSMMHPTAHYADSGSAQVVLHFQPRFQIVPVVVQLGMRCGECVFVDVEFDGRLVHH